MNASARGFDKLSPEERGVLARTLLDKASSVTPEEEEDLSVLMLMGLGLTEKEARADLDLRRRQQASMTPRPPKKMMPPWMR